MILVLSLVVVALAAIGSTSLADNSSSSLVNGGFENGLAGWGARGDVGVNKSSPTAGTTSLQIGPGNGAVVQEYKVGGLRIVEVDATVRAVPANAGGLLRVKCWDNRGRSLMNLASRYNPAKGADETQKLGIYFKTQAKTSYITVSVERDSAERGYVYVDNVGLIDYDIDRKDYSPICNLDQYMQPIWEGQTVYNETLLLLSHSDEPASGRLLFIPERILSVQNYALDMSYNAGEDYTLSGNIIAAAPGSRIPQMKPSDFPSADFPWYELDGKHIVVTYSHSALPWNGPLPQYQGERLRRTVAKLEGRRPLTVVVFGDSITLGDNVSGYMQIPPYMPTWAQMFVRQLRKDYRDDSIVLYNTALGGMTSQWGMANANDAVAALNPDLVIVAFGMNDFWSISGDEFKKNIQGIIEAVRKRRPNAEFILISSMLFDPAYTSDPQCSGHLISYRDELRSLAGDGVAFFDVTSLSQALYDAKNPKDLIANPMHPNDFLARWYAQGLTSMVDKSYVK